ncbi:MAG: hypothetical protein J0H09_11820 [Burkholderiales bacterium]|nr:hypothetical protein [Burkholderiales bacterium]
MQKTYPAVVFVSKYGRRMALAFALATALVLQIPAVMTQNAAWSLGGLLLAALVWGGVRVAVEVVEVVADTLLPR